MMVLVDSEKVRNLMFEKVLSVKELARTANLNSSTISQISSFDKCCRLKTVARLAKGLGVKPDFIIK